MKKGISEKRSAGLSNQPGKKKTVSKAKILNRIFRFLKSPFFLSVIFKKEEHIMPRTRKTYEEQLEANENQIQNHLNKVQELN